MIVTKLIGGLGNQMFQYAAGKALAMHHGVELFIDVTELNKDTNGAYTKRDFALTIFDLNVSIANKQQLQKFSRNKYSNLLNNFFPFFYTYFVLNERSTKFDSNFFTASKNTLLNGYWQSEKYFNNIKHIIQNDFKIKSTELMGLENYHQLILNSNNSVSLHVRRGDYVNLKSAADFHGTCSLEYYKTAINKLNDIFSDISIFIFSDDIEWCKQNFKFQNQIFVNTNSMAKDLFLMTQCKHNIIANSSYSWWGAWLNQNHEKTIIAPNLWFKNIESKSLDILPDNWITI